MKKIIFQIAVTTMLAANATFAQATINKAFNSNALNTTASWTGGICPVSTDIAVFGTGLTNHVSAPPGGSIEWKGMVMAMPGNHNVTITNTPGATLAIGGDGIKWENGNGVLRFHHAVIAAEDQAWIIPNDRNVEFGADNAESGSLLLKGNVNAINPTTRSGIRLGGIHHGRATAFSTDPLETGETYTFSANRFEFIPANNIGDNGIGFEFTGNNSITLDGNIYIHSRSGGWPSNINLQTFTNNIESGEALTLGGSDSAFYMSNNPTHTSTGVRFMGTGTTVVKANVLPGGTFANSDTSVDYALTVPRNSDQFKQLRFRVDGDTSVYLDGKTNMVGQVTAQNGSVLAFSSIVVDSVAVTDTVTVQSGSSLVFENDVVTTEQVTVDGGSSLEFTRGVGTTKQIAINNNSYMYLDAVATLDAIGSGLIDFANNGSTVDIAGDFYYSAPDGTIRIGQNGASHLFIRNGGALTIDAALRVGTNNSQVKVESGGILTVHNDVTLANSNTQMIVDGIFIFNGTIGSNGIFTLNTGSTLGGQGIFNRNITILGNSTLNIAGAVFGNLLNIQDDAIINFDGRRSVRAEGTSLTVGDVIVNLKGEAADWDVVPDAPASDCVTVFTYAVGKTNVTLSAPGIVRFTGDAELNTKLAGLGLVDDENGRIYIPHLTNAKNIPYMNAVGTAFDDASKVWRKTVNVPRTASSITILLESNVVWTATRGGLGLDLPIPTGGRHDRVVTVNVNENNSATSRTGTVTFKSTSATLPDIIVTVVQGGPVLNLHETSRDASLLGEKFTVDVTADIRWRAAPRTADRSNDWITVTPTEEVNGSGTFEINVAPNETGKSRTGTVSVSSVGINPSLPNRIFTVTQAAPLFEISTTGSRTVESSKGSFGVDVTANISWSTSSDATWLTATNAVGDTSGTDGRFTVEHLANNTGKTRTGTITVSGGGISYTITVTQAAATFRVSQTSRNIPILGETFRVTITANVSWEASATSTGDWLSISSTSGNGNATLTITAAPTNTTSQRIGTITLTGNDESITITVTQAAPIFNVSQTSRSASPAGETFDVAIASNIPWSASATSTGNWLSVSTANGSGNDTLAITASPNTTAASRTGTISITAYDKTHTVTVTQVAPILTIAPTTAPYVVPKEQNSFHIAVTSNTRWTVTAPTWLTIKPDTSIGNATIVVTAEANTGTQRDGTITVSGNNINRSFTVRQLASTTSTTLSVDTTPRNVGATAGTFDITVNSSSNVSWRVASSDTSWLTITTPDTGFSPNTGSSSITVTYRTNPNMYGRTATIIISGGGITCTIAVVQGFSSVSTDRTETARKHHYTAYDTRISARTSTIREMAVRVMDERENKPINVRVHFRAPITKSYNILMIYNRANSSSDKASTSDTFTSGGYGRMWSGREPSIELDSEILILDGVNANGLSPIGARGDNLSERGSYKIRGVDGGHLIFQGLATLDGNSTTPMDKRNVVGGTGFFYSDSFYPASCTLALGRCLGDPERDPKKAEQGGEILEGTRGTMLATKPEYPDYATEIPGVYYPQAALDYVGVDVGILAPAHFFGTYTTRLNKARSKVMEDAMNDNSNWFGFEATAKRLMGPTNAGGKWNIP